MEDSTSLVEEKDFRVSYFTRRVSSEGKTGVKSDSPSRVKSPHYRKFPTTPRMITLRIQSKYTLRKVLSEPFLFPDETIHGGGAFIVIN